MDCAKRFKQARKMFTEAVGTEILNEFVKRTKCHTSATDATGQDEVKKKHMKGG